MAFISPIFLQISLCRRIAKTCNRSKGVVFGVSEKCDPDTLRWENGVKRCVFMLESYFKNGSTNVWVIINVCHIEKRLFLVCQISTKIEVTRNEEFWAQTDQCDMLHWF